MYFVAAVLAILFCLFYAAGQQEIGTLGVEMCRYGSTFCRSPTYVLAGAILAAVWAHSSVFAERRLAQEAHRYLARGPGPWRWPAEAVLDVAVPGAPHA